ncbi:HutD family protein [Agrobacterium tumefaciens]|nr:HutD family protein [Agrobacterium tumefaciens]TQN54855.1 HutD family protein [Agrobacterium tumefaciens]
MKILRAQDYRRMPWKNGKGETVEITVFPAGASVADFGWRVSMAPVVSDGAFSAFEEIDRTLSILTGEGMVLSVEGMAPEVMGAASAPFSFPGDAATHAVLTQGRITDLNVMTRRGRFSHRVRRVETGGGIALSRDATVTMIVVTGDASVAGLALRPLDAVLLEEQEAAVSVASYRPCFVIEIIETAGPD